MSTMKRTTLILAAAIGTAGFGSSAFGQARTWNGNGADNNWSTPANWSTNTVPALSAPTEIWAFGSTANRLATEMNNPYTVARVQFGGTTGHSINSTAGHTLTLAGTGNNQFLNVLTGITGTVNVPISLGTGTGTRSIDTGGTGAIIINGNISADGWNFAKIGTGTLTLAGTNNFAGNFDVNNGEVRIASAAALGTSTIRNTTGNNSRLLPDGAAPLTIPNAIDLSGGTGAITFTATGGPDVTLTGPINTSIIRAVGVANGTTLNVNGVVSGAGGIGKNVEGTIVINGDNQNTGGFSIANGQVHAGHDNAFGVGGPFFHTTANNVTLLALGSAKTFNNTVTLGGSGTLQMGSAAVPNDMTFTGLVSLASLTAGGTKALTVGSGATATFTAGITDEPTGGGASQQFGISKAGPGTLNVGGTSNYTGPTNITGGRLNVNGTHTGGATYTVGTNGTLGGTGSLDAAVNVDGTLAPGQFVGTLSVGGAVTMSSSAKLAVEIQSAGSFDQLLVTGAKTVAGTLEIAMLDDYSPLPSDSFAVIGGAGALTGAFTNVNNWGLIAVLGGGRAFVPQYGATDVVLTDFARVGDVNRDGAVNNLDIASFVGLLTGNPAGGSVGFAGDVNGDGVVNNLDIAPFVALLTGGRPVGDDPDFAPLLSLVPEPASLSLLAIGGLMLGRRRRT